jgi:hypothetical protein
MVGDAADHLAQIGFGIEAVEPGGFDERVGCGGALAADVGSGEQIVLPAQSERANRALGGVGPSGQKGQRTQDECSIRRPSSSNENGGGQGVRLRKRQQKARSHAR